MAAERCVGRWPILGLQNSNLALPKYPRMRPMCGSESGPIPRRRPNFLYNKHQVIFIDKKAAFNPYNLSTFIS
jgi:hypothetical protein